jgi:Zn-finger nucleic acid-binding protein
MCCPNCGAPLHLTENADSFSCPYCRSLYTLEQGDAGVRLLGERSSLACPVCSLPLENAALAGHRLLYCRTCQGMLLAMDDFVALIEELHSRYAGSGVSRLRDRSALERHINCPQCHQPMDTHFYEGSGNIVIDDCSRCALNWLDKGELNRVLHAPDHSGARNTPPW